MAVSYNLSGNSADPIDHLVAHPGQSALAIITGVEGPSYRPVGAIMAIGPGDTKVGNLSSGCIEGDLQVHANDALASGKAKVLRYGRGSPFVDIRLPCGGGLDIMIIPRPEPEQLARITQAREDRQPICLDVDLSTGQLFAGDGSDPETADRLRIGYEPEIRFLIFGKGPEASTFAALVHSIGYPAQLFSPDEGTRTDAAAAGCTVSELAVPAFPADAKADRWTAVLSFFHDHELEPPILAPALQSPVFYVGAQGSQRSAEERRRELLNMGVPETNIARLRGPIGLVPSARDARTLAVSVLAEVLDVSRKP